MTEDVTSSAADERKPIPLRKREFGASIVVEIVVNMTILMISSIILISVVLIWTNRMLESIGGINASYILLPYIFLFAAVIAVFGTMLIRRLITKPLRQILEATQKVAEGDLDYRVHIEEQNEVGQLARAFNLMTDHLRENQVELTEHLRSLERVNHELERTTNQLIFSEKLGSVGRLAAGVAHEIGNPLSTILGYLELIGRSKHLGEPERDMLQRIESEVNRIHRTIKELLEFSRPEDQQGELLDINGLVRSAMSLVSAHKGLKSIATELNLSPDIAAIWGKRNKFEQLLINLTLNAVDAMTLGGKLTIETAVNPDDNKEMEVRVSDTGSGIPEEIIDKIFDPFFTTKEPGRGSGLGLSICLRIAESMGGRIEVQSKPGQGSTFRVYLPAAERDSQEKVE